METAISGERPAELLKGGPGAPSTAHRAKWHTAAALVAIIPAAGAAYGARSVINAFRAMALIGSGGIGAVSIGLYEANRPLLVAALAAAVTAGFLAVALASKRARADAFPGLPFSLLASGLACVPALVLWTAESFSLDVIANRVTGPIGDASQHLANLLVGTIASALVIFVAVAAGAIVSNSRTGHDARTWPRAAAWAGAAVLLLFLAAAFYVRSSYLYEAALRAHL